jgi:hypothetical protein
LHSLALAQTSNFQSSISQNLVDFCKKHIRWFFTKSIICWWRFHGILPELREIDDNQRKAVYFSKFYRNFVRKKTEKKKPESSRRLETVGILAVWRRRLFPGPAPEL